MIGNEPEFLDIPEEYREQVLIDLYREGYSDALADSRKSGSGMDDVLAEFGNEAIRAYTAGFEAGQSARPPEID